MLSWQKIFFLVVFPTSQLREDWKEFSRDDLHLVMSQSNEMDVVCDTVQDLEDAVWEGNKLAVWQICRGKSGVITSHTTTQCLQSTEKDCAPSNFWKKSKTSKKINDKTWLVFNVYLTVYNVHPWLNLLQCVLIWKSVNWRFMWEKAQTPWLNHR